MAHGSAEAPAVAGSPEDPVQKNIRESAQKQAMLVKGTLNAQLINDKASLEDPTAIAFRDNREARRAHDARKLLPGGSSLEDFKTTYNDFVDHVFAKLDAHDADVARLTKENAALRASLAAPSFVRTVQRAPNVPIEDLAAPPGAVLPAGPPDEVADTRLASTRAETSNPDDRPEQIASVQDGQTHPAGDDFPEV